MSAYHWPASGGGGGKPRQILNGTGQEGKCRVLVHLDGPVEDRPPPAPPCTLAISIAEEIYGRGHPALAKDVVERILGDRRQTLRAIAARHGVSFQGVASMERRVRHRIDRVRKRVCGQDKPQTPNRHLPLPSCGNSTTGGAA